MIGEADSCREPPIPPLITLILSPSSSGRRSHGLAYWLHELGTLNMALNFFNFFLHRSILFVFACQEGRSLRRALLAASSHPAASLGCNHGLGICPPRLMTHGALLRGKAIKGALHQLTRDPLPLARPKITCPPPQRHIYIPIPRSRWLVRSLQVATQPHVVASRCLAIWKTGSPFLDFSISTTELLVLPSIRKVLSI